MKTCNSEIKRFIASLPPGQLFSTAQILSSSSNRHARNTIDQALTRLVHRGTLERLTSGMFVESQTRKALYTNLDIVKAKTENKAKTVQVSFCKDHENDTSTATSDLEHKGTFCTLDNSTRFRYEGKYIYIKKVSAKKLQLISSEIGAIVLSLWQNGKDLTDAAEIARTIAPLSRTELEEFIALAPCMPNWLSTRAKEAIGPKWQKIERELQQKK
ncbi:hypothetical protein KBI23_25270 [bacterium]|nr:hypothetical protein [bacterium]MBP9811604.1 hypothetical protein [bacterium]